MTIDEAKAEIERERIQELLAADHENCTERCAAADLECED